MGYVELRCKSNFSFLTGASHPEELVGRALEQNLQGLAMTDLNGVYGMPRGYKIAKENPQFKYICGSEVGFTEGGGVTVLARTRAAYGAITSFLTEVKTGREKGATGATQKRFLDFFSSRKFEELIFLPRWEACEGREGHEATAVSLRERFGRQVYLPLTFYLDGRDHERMAAARSLSRRLDLPLVASNDVEYHVRERKPVQDVLISIRERTTLTQAGFRLNRNGERYLKSYAQMRRLYKDIPEALSLTLEIAESCVFSPAELRYRYPSEWIPQGFSAQSYLERLVERNLPERYPSGVSERVRAQVQHELKLINELHFADYFLTIYDIVEFAKEKDILCQGRGSAANSVICYILGITAIDPVQMDMLFERFISVERGEPPDIDIDFEHERREEVIQYIYNKYGRERAAMISAVVTYGRRNAFREVAKVFGVPVGTLSARKVEEGFDDLVREHPHKEGLREQVDAMAKEIQGFPRHLSIHSGGFTLSADAITDIVPVEPARMEGRTIIQWDKYDLDTLGLIKVDILALGMLTCLQKALKMVGKKLYEIPHDDKPTYEMIQRCETVGVFQIESRAQMSMLGRLKPENFYDLVVEVAIVRPGPIVGDMVHPYLRRRQGLEKVEYPHPVVEKILGRTLGVPLFQEQIMKLAIDLAGFTPGEADILRKSINAWRSSAPISEITGRLMRGLIDAGMTREFAERIFKQIQGFSHYGFPESHAASFALLAYASCYLKRHHPAEFACSLVNSQPMGFYRPDTILYETIRAGVKVLPVSISKSEWDCTMEGENTIRLGFRLINGIARADIDHLIEERRRGDFQSLSEFTQRTHLKRGVVEKLAMAGRFADLKWQARDALWAILEYQNLFQNRGGEQQMNLFRDTDFLRHEEKSALARPSSPFQALGGFEKIQNDYEAFSLSVHGHPMSEIRKNVKGVPRMTSVDVRAKPNHSKVSAAGLTLIRQKPPTANGVCFATLEDEFGFMDLVLWKDVFAKYRDVFLQHCFIIIEGVTHKDGNTVSVIVNRVRPLWGEAKPAETPLVIEADQYFY